MLDWIVEVDWIEFFQTYAILWALVFLAYPFIKGYYWLFPGKPNDEPEPDD